MRRDSALGFVLCASIVASGLASGREDMDHDGPRDPPPQGVDPRKMRSVRLRRAPLAIWREPCTRTPHRMKLSLRRTSLVLLSALVAAGALAAATSRHAVADEADKAEKNARCAARLSITLLGLPPDPGFASSQNPQAAVDGMLQTAAFTDHFASFVNAQFNGGPVTDPTQDPVYFLARYVVAQQKPWTDLFVGAYDLVPSTDKTRLDVVPSATGLGYFRTKAWMVRYAGNEAEGVRISAAYHMIQNTTGLQVPASVAVPGEDRTATGRKAPGCAGCHYDPWFALDKAASVLSRKKVDAQGNVTFDATSVAPTQLLGKTLANDADLVRTLVDSDAFRFNQCRLVFQFLYGRAENQCEGPIFDRCVDALQQQGTITAAIAAVVKDPSFCQ